MRAAKDLQRTRDEISAKKSKPPCGPFVGLLAGDQYPHGSDMGRIASQREKGNARAKRQRDIGEDQPETLCIL